jgi:citronellol/citronellal dehydrogenase
MSTELHSRTILITGGSRGIGKAIGLRCARDGANIAITAKPVNAAHQGLIDAAVAEFEAAGGQAMSVNVDIRDEDAVGEALAQIKARFGGIDALVNNASAVQITGDLRTSHKRYDLMHKFNTTTTTVMSKMCAPYLADSRNPHILMISPPISGKGKWFAPQAAYTTAKTGMSFAVMRLADELRGRGIGVNALWHRYLIATDEIRHQVHGEAMARRARRPDMMGDAAYYILIRQARKTSGNFFIDADVLKEEGVKDLDVYRLIPLENEPEADSGAFLTD